MKVLIYLVRNHSPQKRGLSFTLNEVQDIFAIYRFSTASYILPKVLSQCLLSFREYEQDNTEEGSCSVALHFLTIASRYQSFWGRYAPKQEIMKLSALRRSPYMSY